MVFRKLVLDSLKAMKWGSLEMTLPDGQRLVFGGLYKGLQARIEVRDDAFFRRCTLFGPIGFGESHMLGEWDTPDITKVIAWFILNADESGAMETRRNPSNPALNILNAYNRFVHLRRPNSRKLSRKNIGDHYDLSNAFFKLWLDPTMTYSSAYFSPPTATLEQAQIAKYDRLCRNLHLTPSDSVLEIGSGWGGFSIHAAKTHGCRVTTLTISEQQFAEASERITTAGLDDRIEILLCDYRDITGRFDKIVSIEMLEAVGERYVDAFFAQCDRLLKPRGLLGLQAILCPDKQYPILRDGVDFIQKHIFPGSLLMSVQRIADALHEAGDWNLLDYKDLAPHYAKTLALWRDAFDAKHDEVAALGFDEVFIRKWRYYLSYCEAAFATRHITVAQLVYTRPNNVSIPSAVCDLLP
jgi:cyclopropane-fatty-acyl-phospholipid synthase